MASRLRTVSWGTIIIALAYAAAVLPFEWSAQLFWVGLATAGAYLVLARRTAQTTVQLAQQSSQPTLSLWKTAFTSTLMNPVLLAVPLFLMTLAAQKLFNATYACGLLTSGYCFTWNTPPQWETVLLAIGVLSMFVLLDHALIIALTLLTQKYMIKSPVAVSNAAVSLRVLLAGFTVGVVAFGSSGLQMVGSGSVFGNTGTFTARRVIETTIGGFEPLAADGVFLAANMMNRSSRCYQWDQNTGACTGMSDNRPFLLRQAASGLLGMLLYGVLIAAVLRLVSPFSLRLSVSEKSKRGLDYDDYSADIVTV